MATRSAQADAAVVADLLAHGPSRPGDIAKRIGRRDASDIWRSVLRMANAGQITFDDTRRIASLTLELQEKTT